MNVDVRCRSQVKTRARNGCGQTLNQWRKSMNQSNQDVAVAAHDEDDIRELTLEETEEVVAAQFKESAARLPN